MRKTASLDGAYFDQLYGADADPWKFASSPYEQAKYARTLEVLKRERAKSALEVGCSIGVFTRQLAGACDALIATDISAKALEAALERCVDVPNVTFQLAASSEVAPVGPFDLVVLSEVLYYWDDGDLARCGESLKSRLSTGARLILVHWLGETDYPKTADEAVDGFAKALDHAFQVELSDRTDDYRMDLWRWTG